MAAQSYDLRFRHINGDIGPIQFPLAASVSDVKLKLWQDWPTDGPVSRERPGSPAEVKLICSGRFLDDAQTLKSLTSIVGPPVKDQLVTIHVVLRPVDAEKGAVGPAPVSHSSRSCCVIS
ncbi:FAP287 [Auxenochlorella protothecoides x Auxenochlorella symbiontica]